MMIFHGPHRPALVCSALAAFMAISTISVSAQAKKPSVKERLERARSAYDGLDYELALADFEQVIADPRASEKQRTVAFLHAGIICRVLERNVEAEKHLKAALRLNLDVMPPAGSSPKITAFFQSVRVDVQAELKQDANLKEAQKVLDQVEKARDEAAKERQRAEQARADAEVDAEAARKIREQEKLAATQEAAEQKPEPAAQEAPQPTPESVASEGGGGLGTSLLATGAVVAVLGGLTAAASAGSAVAVYFLVLEDSSQPADLRTLMRNAVLMLGIVSAFAGILMFGGGGMATAGLLLE